FPLQPSPSNAVNVDSANNNRFSALNTHIEDVECLEKVAGLEGRVDFEEVESSSQGSEFVAATQPVQVADRGEAQGSIQKIVSKEALQDRQFLNESWANMAENEDEEIRLLIALEKEPSPSNFTVVTSKTSKKEKAKATKNTKSLGTYGTRS
ncbi:hypothetical protein A2U01_0053235, partial [Trifolium medium]|nr:hypothetical protein [Trifolium medium]